MQARSHALLAVAIAAALVVAACGGADDTAGGGSSSAGSAAPSGGAKTQLSLVAYSTPQVVYDEGELGLRTAGRGGGDRDGEQGVRACLHWGVLQSR